MSIPASFIQELLARVDVVDVVGRYVPLKKGGANFMGLCPFHGEKSPSFSVSPSKQFFHCFGCGKSGNAIGFLMEHVGLGFVEAVNDLAGRVGLVVPQDEAPAHERQRAAQQRQQHTTLNELLEKAGSAWRAHLKAAPHAIAYLKQRGISGSIAKHYGLGYAPAGWRSLASVFPEYDNPLLETAGLVITGEEDAKRYDRFRDRIMFPIRNVKGECIGFGGRVLGEEKPKYLNSPETPVFHKGQELYGLFEARQALREHGYALVTEGYMDVVALAQLGFANAVATLGTACTPEHIHKLFRFTEHVVFSFDGDTAGQRAARKALDAALPYASDTRSIKFLFLPPEHDPDSFIRSHGPEAFARHVTDAMPLSRFLVEAASQGCDLGVPEGRAHMASKARPLWQALPEGALKRQLLAQLAQLAHLAAHDLFDAWQQKSQATHSAHSAPTPLPPADWALADAASAGERSAVPSARFAARPSQGGWKKFDRHPPWPTPYQGPRPTPTSRADQAALLLLAHTTFWEALTHEDHGALCALPEPHGSLFSWLETQVHEHGPQPWAVLQEKLPAGAHASLAQRLMGGPHAQPEGEEQELQHELRGVLNRILMEHIKTQETQAAAALHHDPAAAQHLRALQTRRQELQKQAQLHS